MKIRYAAGAIALALGTGIAVPTIAQASGGTPLQTVSKSETIVNSRCYTYHQVTVTYYHWSSTKGWVRYAAPKVTTTTGETCH